MKILKLLCLATLGVSALTAQTQSDSEDSAKFLKEQGVKTKLPAFRDAATAAFQQGTHANSTPTPTPQTGEMIVLELSQTILDRAKQETLNKARQYATGNGVKQDLDKATQLYSQALNTGDYSAALRLYNLARCFQFGDGAQKDPERAKTIFNIYHKRCAQSSDPWAMLALGLSYKDGVGTTPQYRTAISLLLKVVDKWQGTPWAKDLWKVAVHELTQAATRLHIAEGGEGLSHPERVDWGILLTAFSKAASFGDPYAEVDLGICTTVAMA